MRKTSLKLRLFDFARLSSEYIVAGTALIALYTFKLIENAPALSPNEKLARDNASVLSDIVSEPTFAFYKLTQNGLMQFGYESLFLSRLVSVAFGLVSVALVYYVLNQWHTRRIALIGTFLYATSAWLLTVSRLAVPDITYTLILALVVYGTWIRYTKRSGLAILLGGLISGFMLYIPGMIWLIMIGAVWQRRIIVATMREAPRMTILAALIIVTAFLPFAIASFSNNDSLVELSGLSSSVSVNPQIFLQNMINSADALFFRGPDSPETGLVGSALIDPFITIMVVMGVYAYIYRRRLDRAKLLAGIIISGLILNALGGPVSLIMIMPFIYLVAVAGITLLIQQWFTVFPRNPIARFVGIAVITVAVLLSGYYQLSKYYVAWPDAPATRQYFKS